MERRILITGGAGFIGSHVVRRFVTRYPEYRIVNLDKLTYAGNLDNLRDIEDCPNYRFVKGDICDFDSVLALMQEERIDSVIHLAAESHVDRSIKDPFTFARTNVLGTLSLLQAAKTCWLDCFSPTAPPETVSLRSTPPSASLQVPPLMVPRVAQVSEGAVCDTVEPLHIFYHISTDEVYGALEKDGGLFTEETKYQPHSPYSASKASSDHFVRAFHDTYGLPTVITNCSNNYGPNQYPEKLIPLFIDNICNRRPLPVYGKGENVRDWLYVEDHASAIDLIFHKAPPGSTYNIGGFNEWRNIDLVRELIKVTDRLLGRAEGEDLDLISYVTDRAGHDLRYAIDSTKLRDELGWTPSLQFEEGLEKTVRWYLENRDWLKR